MYTFIMDVRGISDSFYKLGENYCVEKLGSLWVPTIDEFLEELFHNGIINTMEVAPWYNNTLLFFDDGKRYVIRYTNDISPLLNTQWRYFFDPLFMRIYVMEHHYIGSGDSYVTPIGVIDCENRIIES